MKQERKKTTTNNRKQRGAGLIIFFPYSLIIGCRTCWILTILYSIRRLSKTNRTTVIVNQTIWPLSVRDFICNIAKSIFLSKFDLFPYYYYSRNNICGQQSRLQTASNNQLVSIFAWKLYKYSRSLLGSCWLRIGLDNIALVCHSEMLVCSNERMENGLIALFSCRESP